MSNDSLKILDKCLNDLNKMCKGSTNCFKYCSAPNIIYCKLVINRIENCCECKWFVFKFKFLRKIFNKDHTS